jgi:hypothetical protein
VDPESSPEGETLHATRWVTQQVKAKVEVARVEVARVEAFIK